MNIIQKFKNMKYRSSLLVSLLAMLFVAGYLFNDPVNKEKEKVILEGVIKFLNAVHYAPEDINDDFSVAVYDDFLTDLDPGKRFFTQSDLQELEPYRMLLDDAVNQRDLTFFDRAVEILETSTARSEAIFNKVIGEDLDFSADEKYNLDSDKRDWATDASGLEVQWKKAIKYDVLNRLYRKVQDREKITEEEKLKTDEELLAEAIKQSKKTYTDYFKRLSKERRGDRFEIYVNSIVNYFDPHTDYFSPKDKADFDINMGGKFEGIGARLVPEDEYTKVHEIIPGGPAWKGKKLEVDDKIIKVAQDGEEPLVVIGWRQDDVVQKIRGKKGTKVILTVLKPDGSEKDIEIIRDEVIVDESFARSLILDLDEQIENVGYIKLPKFYSSFEREGGSSCADDVATEISKLKDQNVSGIILDLRNNTGGSLSDVVEMSGLFIEDGPIVQVKPRERPAYVHRDTDEDVLYDGPLIVMVNNISASASEILAAALQDYGRAVIVGSKSTYGKGTVQRFYDLDRAFSGTNHKPLGHLKVTVQKFYRINGGSTQLNGVGSDIVLPDLYHYLDTGEKDYDNAMPWSDIDPIEYDQNVAKLNHIQDLKSRSKNRVDNDATFAMVIDNALRLKESRDKSEFSIDKENYFSQMDQRRKEAEKYDGLFDEDIKDLNPKNLDADLSYINEDQSRITRNEEWLKGIKKDFYLQETLRILRDMIELEEAFVKADKKEIRP